MARIEFSNISRQKKILFIILFFSFVTSLVYSFYFQIKPQVDARAYDTIAWNLVKGNGYRENLEVDILHDYAIARVGPLYEYLLAGIYTVFGHHYEPVWILQAFLHALTAYFIFATALLVFKDSDKRETIGLWAAALIAFYPDLVEISAMLMIETLYLFLMCLMLHCFFRVVNYLPTAKNTDKKSQSLWLAVLAIVSGLAILARPPIIFFIPIILFYLYKKGGKAHTLLYIFFFSLVFIPWTVRNYYTYDAFMPLGAAGSYNLWIGNHEGANGEQEQPQEALDFIASHKIQDLQEESAYQFKSFIIKHPVEFAGLTLRRVNKYVSVVRPMGFWFYQTGLSQFIFLCLSAASSFILFVFGLAGMIKSVRLKNSNLYYLLAFTVMTPLIIWITVVETRYRFQIYPLLAIFAGFFIVSLRTEKSQIWSNKILWLSMLLIFLNGMIDLFLSFDRLKERLGWFF